MGGDGLAATIEDRCCVGQDFLIEVDADVSTMRRLFQRQQFSGLLMIGVMLLALGLANSPLEPLYHLVHHTPVMVRVGALSIDKTLVQWINEGLMVFFFLLVGLEIKRQVLEGQLSTLPQFALPALAALGGMIVPAAVYLVIAGADPVLRPGWAIPAATDIVLALGILSLLGKRVPASLKIFLTALAVFDDIGAVLIILKKAAELLPHRPRC